MAPVTLPLTPTEKLFRKCLVECRDEMQSEPGMEGLVLRFTGGWVRDKLLGVQSHDIDVALSTMTGLQFGQAMQRYLKTHGAKYEDEAKRQGIDPRIKDIHTIAANPEKSKHLETITTRMFGIDVDFVNLRKEVYDESSRNPQMEFGTAEEDALRRDACVNALFYNLDTEAVEDFTKRGLDDMDKKIIRTPLAPYQTFKDDPLRVLRLIRFACRLHYTIEESAREAMKDRTIHEALRAKISRERVGVEVMKIMAGPDPFTGLSDINVLELYGTVFNNPSESEYPNEPRSQDAYDGLRDILEQKASLCLGLRPKEDPALSWFLAAYTPFMADSKKAYEASRTSIKATNNMSKILKEAIDYRKDIIRVLELVEKKKASRADIGMLLRQSKDAWRSHILYSLLCDLSYADFESVTKRYEKLISYIHNEKLEDAHKMAPILNGNEIIAAFGGPKGGAWLKNAVVVLAEWQYNQTNPLKEDAVEMLLSKKAELGVP